MQRTPVNVGKPLRWPISEAVKVGDLVFASGRTGRDTETGQLPPGGIRAETRKALQKVQAALEASGTSLEHAVKCTVYIVDFADFEGMNEAYAEFFPSGPPARVTVQVAGLYGGAHVEIDATAVVPSTGAPQRP